MSHTPGPWAIHPLDMRAVVGPDDLVVADVVNWRDTDDARLIAAAPDLLEALKAACRLYAIEYGKEADDWRAAIAKAEGK